MSKNYLHWCPKGCGKQVIYINRKVHYKCNICNNNYMKQELQIINNI
jgi:hypothetical protein